MGACAEVGTIAEAAMTKADKLNTTLNTMANDFNARIKALEDGIATSKTAQLDVAKELHAQRQTARATMERVQYLESWNYRYR